MQDRRVPLARLVVGYLRVARTLAGLSMAAIAAIMLAQVFSRYVLGRSRIWAKELCRYQLIWQTFLLLSLAISKGEIVTLDFVPSLLSARLDWLLRAMMAVPIMGFLGVMAWYGWNFAERMGRQRIPALDFIWTAITGEGLRPGAFDPVGLCQRLRRHGTAGAAHPRGTCARLSPAGDPEPRRAESR